MKISVKVVPSSSVEKVEYLDDQNIYKVWTKVAPVEGKANLKVVELLAEKFKISKQNVSVVSGNTSKNKIIEIKEN